MSLPDRIGRIVGPPQAASPQNARAPLDPLPSVPVLIGWMLGPPSPMPRRRALVDGNVQVVPPPASDVAAEGASSRRMS